MTGKRDRREEILVRLLVICDKEIEGIKRAWRNKDELSEHERPCIRFWDGDEGQSESVTQNGHRGGGGHVYVMTPVVGIALGGAPETIGSLLNAMRIKVIKAITTDAAMLDACGRNGGIRYLGLNNAIEPGRAAEGEMLLQFAIAYPLIPGEL